MTSKPESVESPDRLDAVSAEDGELSPISNKLASTTPFTSNRSGVDTAETSEFDSFFGGRDSTQSPIEQHETGRC